MLYGNSRFKVVIILLIIAVGLSIGFASYSKSISISESASITPSPSDFNVGLSTTNGSLVSGTVTPTIVSGTATAYKYGKIININFDGVKFANLSSGHVRISSSMPKPKSSQAYGFLMNNTSTAYGLIQVNNAIINIYGVDTTNSYWGSITYILE